MKHVEASINKYKTANNKCEALIKSKKKHELGPVSPGEIEEHLAFYMHLRLLLRGGYVSFT